MCVVFVCVLPLKAADGFASVVNCRIDSQAEAETLRALEKTKKSNDNSYTCECYNRIFGKLIWFSFSMLRFMQWTSECNAVCIWQRYWTEIYMPKIRKRKIFIVFIHILMIFLDAFGTFTGTCIECHLWDSENCNRGKNKVKEMENWTMTTNFDENALCISFKWILLDVRTHTHTHIPLSREINGRALLLSFSSRIHLFMANDSSAVTHLSRQLIFTWFSSQKLPVSFGSSESGSGGICSGNRTRGA